MSEESNPVEDVPSNPNPKRPEPIADGVYLEVEVRAVWRNGKNGHMIAHYGAVARRDLPYLLISTNPDPVGLAVVTGVLFGQAVRVFTAQDAAMQRGSSRVVESVPFGRVDAYEHDADGVVETPAEMGPKRIVSLH